MHPATFKLLAAVLLFATAVPFAVQNGPTPFHGTPAALPGVLQAEDFDLGDAGVAYFDRSPGNNGGLYRSTDVDIEATSDSGGGYNIGWISPGDWLRYTVHVASAGTYTLEFRVAASAAGGTFHLEVNGADKTGPLTIPNTGGWQSWTTVRKTGVSLGAGNQVWRIVFDGAGPTGVVGNLNYIRVVTETGGGSGGTNSTPFGGTPVSLPGTIQTENFDDGGANVAYKDTTTGNSGGQYRSTDVDIEATADTGGGYNVGWMAVGEWLKYTVNVAAAGTYTLEFRVAARAAGGTFHLEVNGVDKTGPLTIPNTGSYQTWTTISKSGVSLSAGEQVWRLVIDAAGTVVGNLNWIRATAASGGGSGSTPFSGTPISLPGTIQVENFDNGGAGVAYHDRTSGNQGGQYRATDVDIEATSDSGGGYNVGWVSPGDWLIYSVDVRDSGVYDIDVRVASGGPGGTFHIEVDGVDKTGPLAVPDTGGWQNWTTIRKGGVSLTAGAQRWRVVMDTSSGTAVGNFNWIRVSSAGSGTGVTLVRAPYLQQVTDTRATIVWTTREPGAAAVRYTNPAGLTVTATASTRQFPPSQTGLSFDFYQHEALLPNLAPASSYTYDVLVNGVDATPGLDRFRTAPPPGSGTVRFIAFGDSGTGSSAQRQLAERMAADTFDLAIHAGDVAYGNSDLTGGGHYRQYDEWFFSIYASWLRARPFFPSIGNHDDEIQAAQAYRNVFVLPRNGASATFPDHAERYYSFDYGPVHFVALDTETAFNDPARRQAQIDWLESDLASTSQPWRIAYFHRSPYTAGGGHGSDLRVRQAFAPIFERYNVQLVISAHEHVYERSIPWREHVSNGGAVTYVVSGGGGALLYTAGASPWTAASASVHHYVRVWADGCTLIGEAVGLSGSAFDTFHIQRCQ